MSVPWKLFLRESIFKCPVILFSFNAMLPLYIICSLYTKFLVQWLDWWEHHSQFCNEVWQLIRVKIICSYKNPKVVCSFLLIVVSKSSSCRLGWVMRNVQQITRVTGIVLFEISLGILKKKTKKKNKYRRFLEHPLF